MCIGLCKFIKMFKLLGTEGDKGAVKGLFFRLRYFLCYFLEKLACISCRKFIFLLYWRLSNIHMEQNITNPRESSLIRVRHLPDVGRQRTHIQKLHKNRKYFLRIAVDSRAFCYRCICVLFGC